MKEQTIRTNFKCDRKGCKKEIKDCEKFPYEEGWCFLYNLSFKLGHNVVPGTIDKHFCSKEHMKEFIAEEIDNRLTALFG